MPTTRRAASTAAVEAAAAAAVVGRSVMHPPSLSAAATAAHKAAKAAGPAYPLRTFLQLPAWARDNEFVTSGYRFEFNLTQTLRSVFKLHNETLNIWTHLGGFLVFVFLTFWVAACVVEPDSVAELPAAWAAWARDALPKGTAMRAREVVARWPIFVYCAGAMCCLGASTVCHTLGAMPRHISQAIWRFDYAAISIMITTSCFPPVFYTFLCLPHWRLFYLCACTVTGAAQIILALDPRFMAPAWRTTRAGTYLAQGTLAVVPPVPPAPGGLERQRHAAAAAGLHGVAVGVVRLVRRRGLRVRVEGPGAVAPGEVRPVAALARHIPPPRALRRAAALPREHDAAEVARPPPVRGGHVPLGEWEQGRA
eukprot:CAMPEP_0183800292 /NCGR_PEP_ID=MMETSP0803_2-20130417/24408_1 /TAXON_ID=195967 /ORGANISM="Crustomastix stigmata, Strain CCMP3273" /LENGTH=366 /DNA_ID=CAMNT_0026045003 /DNA_START=51 /DNA_END=1146 /DNA_ORIENTATION=-